MPVNQSRPPPSAAPAARPAPGGGGDGRLYLKEDELDRAVDLVLTASRGFFRAAEAPLQAHDLGPAHYRALASIRRAEGLPVSALQDKLEVRKQSLARVLSELEKAGMVTREVGAKDRRQRLVRLTDAGREAERAASAALRERLAHVFRVAGADAVAGARAVLAALAETNK